jgi:hypothetical protein
MHGTDHVIKPREIRAEEDTKNHGAEEGANETLKGLLWGEFDEWGATDGDSPDIGKYIITDHEGCGDPEPDEAFEDIIHDEVTDIPCISMGHKELKWGIVPRDYD